MRAHGNAFFEAPPPHNPLKPNMKYKQQLLADFNSRTNYDSGRFYTPVAKHLIEFGNLKTGQQVLDVATGTGIVALSAAQIVGASGKIIGVDISAGMLSYAKQKLAAAGLENVEFIEADAEHLNFADNSFDRILCSLAICYLTDIPAALQQCKAEYIAEIQALPITEKGAWCDAQIFLIKANNG